MPPTPATEDTESGFYAILSTQMTMDLGPLGGYGMRMGPRRESVTCMHFPRDLSSLVMVEVAFGFLVEQFFEKEAGEDSSRDYGMSMNDASETCITIQPTPLYLETAVAVYGFIVVQVMAAGGYGMQADKVNEKCFSTQRLPSLPLMALGESGRYARKATTARDRSGDFGMERVMAGNVTFMDFRQSQSSLVTVAAGFGFSLVEMETENEICIDFGTSQKSHAYQYPLVIMLHRSLLQMDAEIC